MNARATSIYSGIYRISVAMRITPAAAQNIYISFQVNGINVQNGTFSSYGHGLNDYVFRGTSLLLNISPGDIFTIVAYTSTTSTTVIFRGGGTRFIHSMCIIERMK